MLAASAYCEKIDLWSVGCILYEVLARKPLFTGKDHLDQIRKIIEKFGTPTEKDLTWMPEKGPSRKFLAKCPHSDGTKMKDLLPNCGETTTDFLGKLLTFDPTKRISVKDSMQHPYIKDPDYPEDEPLGNLSLNIINQNSISYLPTLCTISMRKTLLFVVDLKRLRTRPSAVKIV